MNPATLDSTVIFRIAGTIECVDVSSRELCLRNGADATLMVVPPDCVIRLNGERVKLRMLQSGDRAELEYSLVGGVPYAHSVQVNWMRRGAAAGSKQE